MRVPVVAVVRSLVVAAVLAGSALAATGTPAGAATTTGVVQGADISWPNCPKGEGIPSRRSTGEPLPLPSASFVVVGLTNGPGFHPNPCLASQLRWVTKHQRLLAAYALTTYPSAAQIARYGGTGPYDGTTVRGALQNASYAEAEYNLSTMSAVGLTVPMLWVDVEPYPAAPWSDNHAANRAVISAVTAAYAAAGYRIGIYTNPNGWPEIVGRATLPSLPTWSTIGAGHRPGARRQCSHGPSGGQDWIVQWWVGDRDFDVLCPAGEANLSSIFTVPSASAAQTS
jgi:hypothetical protein